MRDKAFATLADSNSVQSFENGMAEFLKDNHINAESESSGTNIVGYFAQRANQLLEERGDSDVDAVIQVGKYKDFIVLLLGKYDACPCFVDFSKNTPFHYMPTMLKPVFREEYYTQSYSKRHAKEFKKRCLLQAGNLATLRQFWMLLEGKYEKDSQFKQLDLSKQMKILLRKFDNHLFVSQAAYDDLPLAISNFKRAFETFQLSVLAPHTVSISFKKRTITFLAICDAIKSNLSIATDKHKGSGIFKSATAKATKLFMAKEQKLKDRHEQQLKDLRKQSSQVMVLQQQQADQLQQKALQAERIKHKKETQKALQAAKLAKSQAALRERQLSKEKKKQALMMKKLNAEKRARNPNVKKSDAKEAKDKVPPAPVANKGGLLSTLTGFFSAGQSTARECEDDRQPGKRSVLDRVKFFEQAANANRPEDAMDCGFIVVGVKQP